MYEWELSNVTITKKMPSLYCLLKKKITVLWSTSIMLVLQACLAIITPSCIIGLKIETDFTSHRAIRRLIRSMLALH